MNQRIQTVEEYINQCPEASREKLVQLRALIKKTATKAEEGIGYGMPAYRQDGTLLYFGGYARHIGFYPSGSGITHFADELQAYKFSKGAVQFPLDKPLPIGLITRMIRFRVKENKEKATQKKKK